MLLLQCTLLFILLSSSSAEASSNEKNFSNPLIEIAEEPKAKFGDLIYKALNEKGLNKETSNKKPKRVRMSDVPYFDILNRNREFRRQIISPGQLPRQPKERWKQGKGTNTKLSDQKFFDSIPIKSHQVEYDETAANSGSKKRAKQLHYYGPEFLKLLGLSYASKLQHDKGADDVLRLTKSRSLKEIKMEENANKKHNKTTEAGDSIKDTFLSSVANVAGSQLGVALASNVLGQPPIPQSLPSIPSRPSQHGSFPNYPNNDHDYNDEQEYNVDKAGDDNGENKNGDKMKKNKKKKIRPNKGPNRFSQPAYSPYSNPYSPYSGGHHPGLVSSGLIGLYQQQPGLVPSGLIDPYQQQQSLVSTGFIDPYQQQLVGNGPGLQSNFVPGGLGYPGSIGSISGITHVPSNAGNLYQQPFPPSYSNSGFPSSRPITAPTISNSGYASSVPVTTPTLSSSGVPSSASISTPTFSNSGFPSSGSSTFSNSGLPSSASSSFSNSGFPSSASSSYSNSGFPSNYPLGHGYTQNAFAVPYYGNTHGRTEIAAPESRKKGSTSVKKVVGGALAAGNQ